MSPRLLTRTQAAEYCGMSETKFSDCVKAGDFPPPVELLGFRNARWDIKDIDRYLDCKSGLAHIGNQTAADEAIKSW